MSTESHLSSFEILSGDFRRLTEFVEPVDANLGTYSHQVKHNRNTLFSLANLENVRSALSGLFALLAQLGILPTNQVGHQERHIGGFKEVLYPQQIFSVRYPI